MPGGNGSDTLRLDGGGLSLNLTTLADNRLLGIEQIDLTGNGNNTLTLDLAEVLNLSDESNTLIVDGNSGDRVLLDGGWTRGADDVVGPTTYRVLTNGAATLKVASLLSLVTPPSVTLSVSPATLAEAAGTSTVTATLSAVSDLDVTVDLAYNGTAANPDDYSRSATLTAVQGALDEANETIVVDISGATNGTELGTQQVTATIIDELALSISNVSAVKAEGNTGDTPFTFSITRTGSLAGTASVKYTVTGGIGLNDANTTDFGGAFPSDTVSFIAGQTTATITINVRGDTTVETDETFLVSLSNSVNAGIANATATGTILSDDASLAITPANAIQNEGDSGDTPFTFIVTREGDLSRIASVKYVVSANGPLPAVSSDFGGTGFPSGMLTFAVGESVKTITVSVRGDTTVEGDEGFKVKLVNAVNATLTTDLATGTILNDDASIAMVATSANTMEGSSALSTQSIQSSRIAAASANTLDRSSATTPFTFTITRTGDTREISSVDFVVSGAAKNGADASDFGVSLPQGTVTFAATETSKTITLGVVSDTTVEMDEGFTVTLSHQTNAMIGTASASGTIKNDDSALAIAATNARKSEGKSGNTAFTFTITRTGDRHLAASVHFAITGSGTNSADAADFVVGTLPSGTITFAANRPTATLTINVLGDTAVELDEGFTVMLSDATNATLTTATASGTIKNDDALLAISPVVLSQAEGNSGTTPFTFTVTRTGDLSRASNVKFTVSGNGTSAADKNDFGGTFPSGVLNFGVNETTKTLIINVRGDTTVESHEGFKVTLSSAVNASLDPSATVANGTLQNDDGLTLPAQDNAASLSSHSVHDIHQLFSAGLPKLLDGIDGR